MPWGFQKFEAPRFQDNRHIKVVRLSALPTGRIYPPGIIPDTHFCWGLVLGSITGGVTGDFCPWHPTIPCVRGLLSFLK
jgi:hypothetical protein